MSVWSVPADGSAAPARLTAGDTTDLWPSLDSLPQPRVFYESLLDGRPGPRLFVTRLGAAGGAGEIGATGGTDLAQTGSQPHVSPTADAVLFDAPAGPAVGAGQLPPPTPPAGACSPSPTPAAGRRS